MHEETLRERHTQWERRFQSVLLSVATALIVAAVSWGSKQLVTLTAQNAVTTVQLAAISVQMSQMYTAADAHRDITDVDERIDGNTKRMDTLDLRLRRVELHPTQRYEQ